MDRLSPETRSHLMRQVKGANTSPELFVRSILHRLGYRFRVLATDLPGTPDIVLPRHRCAIFVNGCFWHGHGCRTGQPPKSKLEYWGPKLAENRARDSRKSAALESLGWTPITVWQCELRQPDRLAWKLIALLEGASSNYHASSPKVGR